ncbi:MAG TPA: AI-2E family transporter [Rhodanobacteraceae bacterium]|nr:AI-2E family transporter [Rhodanobacteraceae bacterium]
MSTTPAPPPPVELIITAGAGAPPVPPRVILGGTRRKRRPGALARRRARRIRALQLPLLVLMFLAIATLLVVARTLIIPLVLAAFVGMGLNPVVRLLNRIYIPRALGALLVLAAFIALLSEAAVLITGPAADWVQQAPQALHQLAPKIRHLMQPLNAATHAASQSLVGFGVGAPAPSGTSPPSSFGVSDLLLMAPRILAEALTVLLLVFFFLTYGDHLRRRLVAASPRFAYRRIALNLVRGIQHEISRYLLTVTIINSCLGALTALILWYWGMPDPVLWGCVVALLNFMPYIGAITSTCLLCVVGLLQFNVLSHALAPAACFAVLAALEGNVITPMIMGRRLRLSPVAILLWLLIWGWMWGIPGALLAVPMLTCVKLIAERVPGWEWFSHMVEH